MNKIDLVCGDCAKKRGARIPEHHIATFYIGRCDLCEKQKEVTQSRDYGRTRYLLNNN